MTTPIKLDDLTHNDLVHTSGGARSVQRVQSVLRDDDGNVTEVMLATFKGYHTVTLPALANMTFTKPSAETIASEPKPISGRLTNQSGQFIRCLRRIDFDFISLITNYQVTFRRMMRKSLTLVWEDDTTSRPLTAAERTVLLRLRAVDALKYIVTDEVQDSGYIQLQDGWSATDDELSAN